MLIINHDIFYKLVIYSLPILMNGNLAVGHLTSNMSILAKDGRKASGVNIEFQS